MNLNLKTIFVFINLLSAFVFFRDEAQAEGTKIYISVSGSDTNSGAKDQPVASLNGAIGKLRALKSSQIADAPIEIIIGGGEYFMQEPLGL